MVSPSSESAPGRHPRVVAGLPRDAPPDAPQVSALRSALVDGEYVAIPGMVLLELLRDSSCRTQDRIVTAMALLELIEPTQDDYVQAR